jgi:hypothetical protein
MVVGKPKVIRSACTVQETLHKRRCNSIAVDSGEATKLRTIWVAASVAMASSGNCFVEIWEWGWDREGEIEWWREGEIEWWREGGAERPGGIRRGGGGKKGEREREKDDGGDVVVFPGNSYLIGTMCCSSSWVQTLSPARRSSSTL